MSEDKNATDVVAAVCRYAAEMIVDEVWSCMSPRDRAWLQSKFEDAVPDVRKLTLFLESDESVSPLQNGVFSFETASASALNIVAYGAAFMLETAAGSSDGAPVGFSCDAQMVGIAPDNDDSVHKALSTLADMMTANGVDMSPDDMQFVGLCMWVGMALVEMIRQLSDDAHALCLVAAILRVAAEKMGVAYEPSKSNVGGVSISWN